MISHLWFLIKTLISTIIVVALLQIPWGGMRLEDQVLKWIYQSSLTTTAQKLHFELKRRLTKWTWLEKLQSAKNNTTTQEVLDSVNHEYGRLKLQLKRSAGSSAPAKAKPQAELAWEEPESKK